jgi:hypothetical protein
MNEAAPDPFREFQQTIEMICGPDPAVTDRPARGIDAFVVWRPEATRSRSGIVVYGIEPWIVDAAADLANDAAHIPTIARIIKSHVPPAKF